MASPQSPRSRYARAARAAYLAKLAAAGTLIVLPAACGKSDAEVFAAGASSTTVAAPSTTAAKAPTTTARPPTTPAPTTTVPSTTKLPSTSAPPATAPATTAKGAAAEGTFPVGGELVVAFSYAPAAAARARNPYVAVWVEDSAGKLVQTISLWYEQTGKGSRWLNELRSWYSASGGRPTAVISGATRSAGAYTVAWDGTGANGQKVPAGDYVLFVEAAREHGPHGITSTPLSIGATGFTVQLANSGELSALSATLKA